MRLQTRPSAGSEGLRIQPHQPQESRAPGRCRNYVLVATPSSLHPPTLALHAHRHGRTRRGVVHGGRCAGSADPPQHAPGVARPDAPGLSAFVESPEGARALHRIVLAAIVVFGVSHGAGAATLRLFLHLAGLSHWVACSESTLRRTQARVVEAIGSWGDDTLQRMGRTMPHRELTLLLDETWKRLMILVAMDAPSGFLLLEKHSESRDGNAWNEAMKATFKHLKVRVL